MGQSLTLGTENDMKSPILILISALLTAACAQQSDDSVYRSGAGNAVVTSFASGDQDTIEVQVTDRQPANQVELVAPDGRILTAHLIERDRIDRRSGGLQPSVGVGVGIGSGGHVGSGIGIGFPLSIGGSSREAQVRSTAHIDVSDMAAYRTNWQQWKLRIRFDAPNRTVEVAAPPPPAG